MQQPGQSQDIAVNGSIDFADLSQFGIDTNITFDPSVSLLETVTMRQADMVHNRHSRCWMIPRWTLTSS